MKTIYFHSGHEDPEIKMFSNFYPCEIEDDGIKHYCLETAFQAAKVPDPQGKLDISKKTPQAAKASCGAGSKNKMSPQKLKKWEDGERVEVMRRLLEKKFSLPHLRSALVKTGDAELIERLPRFPDRFWGTLKDGSGQNMLGKLLMEVRASINKRDSK